MRFADLFQAPHWGPLLLAAPLVGVVLWLAARSRAAALSRIVGPRAARLSDGDGGRTRDLHAVLHVAGIGAALVALLQPAWGDGTSAARERGVDVLVCLDVSRSMLARDQAPSRLRAAQREIRALAERAQGDRLGLVVFAGEARLAVPLTLDGGTLVSLADRADPLAVATGGTDLGAALDTAADALADATGDHEVVLLLTDGEDHDGGGLRAAARCARRGIRVHAVSFGSQRGGKIPVQGDGGEVFLRDGSGEEVVSAADSVALTRLAEATGGTFRSSVDTPHVLAALYEDEILPMARKAFGERERQERESRFQWPLSLAVGLLMLELCMARGRRR